MTAEEIIRKAIPGADDGLVDHILWGRTPFPAGAITARSLYKAADSWRRATDNGIELCFFCPRPALKGKWECARCAAVLAGMRQDDAEREVAA